MQKSKPPYILFSICILVTLLILFFLRGSVASLLGFVTGPAAGIYGMFAAKQPSPQPLSENEALRRRLLNQEKLRREVGALRDQFNTQNPSPAQLLPAGIIGAPNFIPRVTKPAFFILGKGSRDGVSVGLPVVYKDNLVGQIAAVADSYSTLKLVNDKGFTVTAKAQTEAPTDANEQDLATTEHQVLGVVRGQGGDGLLLDNVVLSETLHKNDLIVSYGSIDTHGRGIPPDIIIGKIISIDKKASSLFQKAVLQSLVDVTNLSTVFIIMPKR